MSKVLGNLLTIKLKIILLFSFFLLIIVYASIFILNDKTNSKYDLNAKEIKGVVTEKEEGKYLVCNQECIIVTSDLKLAVGDIVILKGNIKKPWENTNFNMFNYKNYLYSNNIYYLFDATTKEVIGTNQFYRFKNKIIEYISSFKSQKYLNTFIMGNSDALEDDIKDSYRYNGISHLLSISGMHISLFAFILKYLLKKIPGHMLLIKSFLLFYVILTGFKLSAIRSFFLFLTSSKIKPIFSLILIFSIMLAYNPYYLYNISFIFSFVITFFILLLPIKDKNYFFKVFKTSLLCFFVSIPILTMTSYEINFLSPILNVFFIPFVSFIIFPLTILTFFIKIFDPVLFYLTNLLEEFSLFSNYFNLSLVLSKPPLWLIIMYYLGIIWTFKKFRFAKQFLLLIIIIFHYLLPKFNPYPVLTMLDVNQGDAILIEFEHQSKVVLIDTGGKYNTKGDISKYTLIPYMKSKGISSIDYLILSHGDLDHAKESYDLVTNFDVKHIIINSGNDSEYEMLLKKYKPYKISEGYIEDIGFKFLNNKDIDDENEDSLIIYTKLNNYYILLMGDAGFTSEEYILNKYKIEKVDILKIGHHGSKYATSKQFLDYIKPKIALISVGKNNNYGHPASRVINDLKKRDIATYMTSVNGSIEIIFGDELTINTCLDGA